MDRISIRSQEKGAFGRRSASAHEPYHSVVTKYSKEVRRCPVGSVTDFPPDVVEALKGVPPHSPPLIRTRENGWTTDNFPIVRVPSAEFTDILSELYDYQQLQKYTRGCVTPNHEELQKEPELEHEPIEKAAPPTYKVIPATPENGTTPRHLSQKTSGGVGIPLTSSALQKTSLPMYEEYLRDVAARRAENNTDENRNPTRGGDVPSCVTPSGGNANMRHIDSSASSEVSSSEDVVVYSHDVFVDPSTGKPCAPGRKIDIDQMDKLKINVYFSRGVTPVVPVYQLEEIEIERKEDVQVCKLRPPAETGISGRRGSGRAPSSCSDSRMSSFSRPAPLRTSLLRKENELVTVPMSQMHSFRHHRPSGEVRRDPTVRKSPEELEYAKKRTGSELGGSERHHQIPVRLEASKIDLDDVFPKMPAHHKRSSLCQPAPPPIEHKTNPSEYVITHQPREDLSRAPNRQSPGELNYGNYPKQRPHFGSNSGKVVDLHYTRGPSKTPSVQEQESNERNSPKPPVTVQIPVEKQQRSRPSTVAPSARSSYNEKNLYGPKSIASEKSSIYGNSQRAPSTVIIPPAGGSSSGGKSAPRARSPSSRSLPRRAHASGRAPYEEVVHIKEKYEKEETIRRFFPTTTAV